MPRSSRMAVNETVPNRLRTPRNERLFTIFMGLSYIRGQADSLVITLATVAALRVATPGTNAMTRASLS